MRKFLQVVGIAALAILVAAPAMALDFKFGGEYRVRLYSGVNNGFDESTATNPRGAQLRVRPRFDVSDDNGNVGATLRLEIGDIEFGNGGGAGGNTNLRFVTPAGVNTAVTVQGTSSRVGNGAGGGLGNDGVNVETKWAYMDFAMPFGLEKYGRIRAGLQPWYTPKGILVDDDAAGLRAYGKVGIVNYDAYWLRLAGGTIAATAVPAAGPLAGSLLAGSTTNTEDNNMDFYGAGVTANVSKAFNPGIYFIYEDNRVVATNPYGWWLGLTTTGQIGVAKYDVDFIYGMAEGGVAGNFANATGELIKTKGWALDGHVAFPVGPVTINLAGSYATGDKSDGGDSEAFPTIAPSWNGAGGGFQMIGSGGLFDAVEFTQDMPTNLYMLGAWVDYYPVKALQLTAAYAYAGFQEKDGNCFYSPAGNRACYGPGYTGKGFTLTGVSQGVGGLAGKSALGHEIYGLAQYTVWTGLKIQAQAGWILPTGDAKTAGEYVLQFLYNF